MPSSSFWTTLIVRLLYCDERIPCLDDDRFRQVHPATFAHGRRRQQAKSLVGAGVDLEDRDTSPGLDALQVEARDDPGLGEPESEEGVFVERQHPTPFPPTSTRSHPRKL